jgi:hypothetical protein
MTPQEYDYYQSAVDKFLADQGIQSLHCLMTEGDLPYLDYEPCDCCGRMTDGIRWRCGGCNTHDMSEAGPYAVCDACLFYFEHSYIDSDSMRELLK